MVFLSIFILSSALTHKHTLRYTHTTLQALEAYCQALSNTSVTRLTRLTAFGQSGITAWSKTQIYIYECV